MFSIESVLKDKVLKELTPKRARLAVLLYGVNLKLSRSRYRHNRYKEKLTYKPFYDAFMHPRKSVWITLLVPSEILVSLGLTPLVMESVGAIVGSLGLTGSFLKYTLEVGVPSSLCTFHRANLSVVLKNGFFPPNCLVSVSSMCDGNLRSLQEISGIYKKPFYFLDIPEPEADVAEVYVAEQIEDVFYSLAEANGVRNPLERLKKALSIAEETRKWIFKVNDLRKTQYLPNQGAIGLAWNLVIHTAHLGSERALLFYKKLYEDLDRYGEEIPKDLKRLVLLHIPPAYKHPCIDLITKKNGLVVIEEYNTINWPEIVPEEPFISIARRLLSVPQIGKPARRIELINRLAQDYNADGILHFAHWGCRQSTGSLQAMRPNIAAPLLSIDTDLVDSESASSGQLATRIESFMEMLESAATRVN